MLELRIKKLKVAIVNDYQELSRLAAAEAVKQLKKNKASVFGLATGATVLGLYQELARLNANQSISFKKAKTFNLDELVGVSQADRGSLFHYMRKNFFSKVDLPHDGINFLHGLAKDWKRECLSYERKIRQAGGIDLQILGIGLDGHIGFDEPGTSFRSRTGKIKLKLITRRVQAKNFSSTRVVPKHGLSMGIATIMRAKKIVLLASGKEKAEVVAQALRGKITPKLPASVLQRHPDCLVILDKAAASRL
jgi:glucosamine-6-phosphate deaminase